MFAAMRFILHHRVSKRSESFPKTYLFKIWTAMIWYYHLTIKSKIYTNQWYFRSKSFFCRVHNLIIPFTFYRTQFRLKKSQCTPLFMLPYRQRAAGAVIHTHSPNAVMATLLWPGKEFRCSYLEMIKVIAISFNKFFERRRIDRPPTTTKTLFFLKWTQFYRNKISIRRVFSTMNSADICATTKNWWFRSLKIHHSKRIWRIVWMQQCKNILDRQQFWCDDMACMCGVIHGKRLKHSKRQFSVFFLHFSQFCVISPSLRDIFPYIASGTTYY